MNFSIRLRVQPEFSPRFVQPRWTHFCCPYKGKSLQLDGITIVFYDFLYDQRVRSVVVRRPRTVEQLIVFFFSFFLPAHQRDKHAWPEIVFFFVSKNYIAHIISSSWSAISDGALVLNTKVHLFIVVNDIVIIIIIIVFQSPKAHRSLGFTKTRSTYSVVASPKNGRVNNSSNNNSKYNNNWRCSNNSI